MKIYLIRSLSCLLISAVLTNSVSANPLSRLNQRPTQNFINRGIAQNSFEDQALIERLTSYFESNPSATLETYSLLPTRRKWISGVIIGGAAVATATAQTLVIPKSSNLETYVLIHDMIAHLSGRLLSQDVPVGAALKQMEESSYWETQLHWDSSKASQAAILFKAANEATTNQAATIGLNKIPWPQPAFLHFVREQLRAQSFLLQIRDASSPVEQWKLLTESLLYFLFFEQKAVRELVQIARQQERRSGQPLVASPTGFLLWPSIEQAMSLLKMTPSEVNAFRSFHTLVTESYGKLDGTHYVSTLSSEDFGVINPVLKPHGYVLSVEGYAPTESEGSAILLPALYKLAANSRTTYDVDQQTVEVIDAEPVST